MYDVTHLPRLETARLILRGSKASDFSLLAAFLMDQERATGFGAAPDEFKAWRWFATNIGHWALRGYGYFIMELKASGASCGLCGIWNPHGWPEPELGWAVYDGYEGQGLAYEAAQRVRNWAYDDLGFTTLTSNIVPGNTRSIALAERMGAHYERTYQNVEMGADLMYRHPAPEAVK